MTSFFRIISILEGLSYLAILSVTFGFISREFVFPLGMGHGLLFMLYLAVSLMVASKRGWPLIIWLMIFLASIIPFAFIPVELYLKKELKKELKGEYTHNG